MQKQKIHPTPTPTSNPFSQLKLKSLEIIRPQYNCSQFRKHLLVFLLDDQMDNSQRKWVNKIKGKYQCQLSQSWKDLGLDKRSGRQGTDCIFVVRDRYEKEILRELKLNPGLRAIIWSKTPNLQRLKDTKISFTSPLTSEIEAYLTQKKDELIIK